MRMREVKDGCKLCGKRMRTYGSILVRRTCDACKAKQVREASRRTEVRRKAQRHAAKAKIQQPHCQHCGKAITDAFRLDGHGGWTRKFCDDSCRQAAFRQRMT